MSDVVAGFDWHDGNRLKCQKHGLTVLEIETVLRGPLRSFPDPDHSVTEARYLGIGRTAAGRHVLIAYTFR